MADRGAISEKQTAILEYIKKENFVKVEIGD